MQHQRVFFDQLGIVILPVIFLVSLSLVKVVCILLGLVGRIKPFLEEILPDIVLEPDVRLDFIWTVETKPIARLPL